MILWRIVCPSMANYNKFSSLAFVTFSSIKSFFFSENIWNNWNWSCSMFKLAFHPSSGISFQGFKFLGTKYHKGFRRHQTTNYIHKNGIQRLPSISRWCWDLPKVCSSGVRKDVFISVISFTHSFILPLCRMGFTRVLQISTTTW